ncbi:Multidrug resistance protein ABC Superfamily [Phytophthora palmivora]|uniref:Multidrug resistance protein ABC Superfamily n=1 Tax=Phytophthora palmivora TaxID=4796 RepID=A0A2P4X452_9STRA|nr:Multidrug resistance protein ABC Superfamily [Phytophthora palmivora]
MKLVHGGDTNLHMCKMFNVRSELENLQYNIEDVDMVDMLLRRLPEQAEFERLQATIRYGANPCIYTPTKVRELIRADAAKQKEFRGHSGGKHGSQSCDGGNDGKHDKGVAKHDKSKGKRQNRPYKANNQKGADTHDQNWKPQVNCTLRHEIPSIPAQGVGS